MRNLSDFKKRLKLGVELEMVHAKLGSLGIRPISIVQSNSFALATKKADGIVNSWCEFPKASNFEVSDSNTAKIFWGEGVNRQHILTYTFIN